MLATLRVPAIIVISSISLAGCAGGGLGEFFNGNGSDVTTSSVVAAPVAPKMDPACPSLGGQIDALRAEGVADKIEKAAAKKYKMTPADLTKADQLTKVNAEYQSKCSTLPRSTVAAAPVAAAAPTPAATPKAATTAKAAAAKAAPAPAGVTKSAE